MMVISQSATKRERARRTMSDKIRCSAKVYGLGGGCGGYQCAYTMKVTRNDKPFCNIHDPVKVMVRKDARKAKWQAEQERQQQVKASADALVEALGMGTPEYSLLFGKWGYTGKIVLTADEARCLIAREELWQ